MKILVLSPHRDDAAFSLTLAIQAWLRAGHTVDVLNIFTRSDYAPFSDAESLHANDRASFVTALRRREDEAWRKQQGSVVLQRIDPNLGVLTLIDLNFKDAPIRLRCPPEEIFTRAVDPNDKAIAKLGGALERSAHAALVVPLALGDHIDHRTVREAALRTGGTQPLAFYEDLPYAASPDVLSNLSVLTSELARALATPLTPALGPASPNAVAIKLRAALCYDSQIDNATAELIAQFATRYSGAERLWANPAWQALGLTNAELDTTLP